ncbi:MAG: 50S ribosomal protein L24e [Candidatus Hodarchaeaceae archaeon]|nr:50S ribosomal protein L24e [Candidatus Hodarchaeaceae archaeon]
MPVARKCSFCGGRVEPGSGLMFVRRDGTISFFCSSKCEHNERLGRKPHRVKWTERSRRLRGKA